MAGDRPDYFASAESTVAPLSPWRKNASPSAKCFVFADLRRSKRISADNAHRFLEIKVFRDGQGGFASVNFSASQLNLKATQILSRRPQDCCVSAIFCGFPRVAILAVCDLDRVLGLQFGYITQSLLFAVLAVGFRTGAVRRYDKGAGGITLRFGWQGGEVYASRKTSDSPGCGTPSWLDDFREQAGEATCAKRSGNPNCNLVRLWNLIGVFRRRWETLSTEVESEFVRHFSLLLAAFDLASGAASWNKFPWSFSLMAGDRPVEPRGNAIPGNSDGNELSCLAFVPVLLLPPWKPHHFSTLLGSAGW